MNVNSQENMRDVHNTYSRDQDVRLLEDALAAGKDVCARVSEGPYSNEWLDALAALDRIVAGSRSLEEQYEVARESSESMGRALAAAHTKLTEYEEQLEVSQAALAAFFAEWDGDVGTYAPTDDTLALMRAASSLASTPEARECGEGA